ncbi:MAG TPA: EF-hand domain-containing protein [Steroidobacteraceae bacterium]|nr:EF-hand domain-containing protein [Steroidobacteraceae bacterium]
MKARKTMIAVAVATLIPLGAAVAGDNDQYGGRDKSMHGTSFKKLDTNKDGRISQAEAAVDSSIMFTTADTNGDGYLDKDELKAAQKSGSSGAESQSSQSPESSSPTSQPTDPNMQQGTEPSGNPSPDTETPRQ